MFCMKTKIQNRYFKNELKNATMTYVPPPGGLVKKNPEQTDEFNDRRKERASVFLMLICFYGVSQSNFWEMMLFWIRCV